jgi:hypothetical protein
LLNWQSHSLLIRHPAPSVPSVPPVIPQPTVSAGSLDGAIQLVVHNAVQVALDKFKAGVDETQVVQLVADAIDPLFTGFKHEVTKQIDELRPQVTNSRQSLTVLRFRFKVFYIIVSPIFCRLSVQVSMRTLWVRLVLVNLRLANRVADSLDVPFASTIGVGSDT